MADHNTTVPTPEAKAKLKTPALAQANSKTCDMPAHQIVKTLRGGTFSSTAVVKLQSTGKIAVLKKANQKKRSQKQLENEIRLLSNLRQQPGFQDHVITLYSTHLNNTVFLMSYDPSCKDLIECICKGKLDQEKQRHVAISVGEALAFIHAVGITHYDIKPENILISANFTAKLIDFGLASDSNKTLKNGSPLNCAPELHHSAKSQVPCKDTRQYDVASFGFLLLMIITAQGPTYNGHWKTEDKQTLALFIQNKIEAKYSDELKDSSPDYPSNTWLPAKLLRKFTYYDKNEAITDLATMQEKRGTMVEAVEELTKLRPKAT